jgi:hypothetical protein
VPCAHPPSHRENASRTGLVGAGEVFLHGAPLPNCGPAPAPQPVDLGTGHNQGPKFVQQQRFGNSSDERPTGHALDQGGPSFPRLPLPSISYHTEASANRISHRPMANPKRLSELYPSLADICSRVWICDSAPNAGSSVWHPLESARMKRKRCCSSPTKERGPLLQPA